MKNDRLFEAPEEKSRRKRGIWRRMMILAALLAAAGALLWRGGGFGQPSVPPDATARLTAAPKPASTPTPSPATVRTARELAYDKDIAALEKLIASASGNEKTAEQAAVQLAKMVAAHQTELGLNEALEKAGFDPCMVLMQNDALTVTVGAKELTATESATILAICTAHSDVAVENIRIMTGQSLYP